MILYETTITVTCDQCGTSVTIGPDDATTISAVPAEWPQLSLPGSTETRQFCTVECLVGYHQQAEQERAGA